METTTTPAENLGALVDAMDQAARAWSAASYERGFAVGNIRKTEEELAKAQHAEEEACMAFFQALAKVRRETGTL
jgi:hypothetical protein